MVLSRHSTDLIWCAHQSMVPFEQRLSCSSITRRESLTGPRGRFTILIKNLPGPSPFQPALTPALPGGPAPLMKATRTLALLAILLACPGVRAGNPDPKGIE